MENANENDREKRVDDGPDGTSAINETLAEFVRYLHHMLADSGSRLTALGGVQIDISKDAELTRVVDEVISHFGVPKLWPAVLASWFAGGPGPLESEKLKIPKKLNQGIPKMLGRAEQTLRSHDDKIAKARVELEKAEAARAAFETEMGAFRLFTLERRLVDRLAGVFAMGPAWTIMRSLSAHVSEQLANHTRKNVDPEEQEKVLAKLRSDRKTQNERMFEILDFFSGDLEFEEAIRKAVLDVCRQFFTKKTELEKGGRHARSADARASRINPKGRKDGPEIIESYNKAS